MKSRHVPEAPLTRAAELRLLAATAGMILLFYLFVGTTAMLLISAIGLEFILALALIRFGAARLVTPLIEQHGAQLRVLGRNCIIREHVQYRVLVQRTEAPKLFALIDRLSEAFNVPVPGKLFLQVGPTASVELLGLSRRSNKTALNLGYDLLAGLELDEIEAVLAHELAHAKLVLRGYRRWILRGVFRAAGMARGFYAYQEILRQRKRKPNASSVLFRISDKLARISARLVAAYSRQDEFAADRGAAEMCGAAPLASALRKLDLLERLTARLPWAERIGQLRPGRSFSAWLLDEIAKIEFISKSAIETDLRNPYATHPTVGDRLAALNVANLAFGALSGHSLSLLGEPDEVAERLLRELQRILGEQELKDSKAMHRWARKQRRRTRSSFLDLVVIAVLITCLLLGIALATTTLLGGIGLVALGILSSVFYFQFWGYRDAESLPLPEFSLLFSTAVPDTEDFALMEKEYLTQVKNVKRRSDRRMILMRESYSALRQCRYRRAHAAAAAGLTQQKDRIELLIACAVSCAALNQADKARSILRFIQGRAGVRTQSLAWGFGWVHMLLRDFVTAEAFLHEALRPMPDQPTLHALLALCCEARGKNLAAVESAQRAYHSNPRNLAYGKLLVRVLLNAGQLDRSQTILQSLEPSIGNDEELIFSCIRLNLLLGDSEKTQKWSERFHEASRNQIRYIALGNLFASARRDQDALAAYRQALTGGFYPEAHLAIGRIEAHRGNRDSARKELMRALDFKTPTGPGSGGPGPLFRAVIAEIARLNPLSVARAWIVKTGTDLPIEFLRDSEVFVYANNSEEALSYVHEILSATAKQENLAIGAKCAEAPLERQPDTPVHAGVHAVLG